MSHRVKLLALFLMLAALAVLAYCQDLNSYFLSDDFKNLGWMREAYAHPSCLWSQFTEQWFGGGAKIAQYYRPMISVLWFLEYAVWKENYAAFIFVNLAVSLASSMLVMLIAYEFQQTYFLNKTNGKLLWLFPICSFGTFALYPLHVEVVGWMSNQCILFETFFSLLCIWSYLQWRRLGQLRALIISNIALVTALLIKESAIVTPAFLSVLAMLTPDTSDKAGNTNIKVFSLQKLRSVYSFWIIFGLYLLVRRLVLGQIVGGWPSYITFYVHSPFQEITISIYRTLVPLTCANPYNTVFATTLWIALIATISVYAIRTLRNTEKGTSFAITLILWFLLGMAPPCRFFSIGKDLLHGILAYPCTVPISIFLGLGIANLPRSFLSASIAVIFFSLSAAEICIDNCAWLDAGNQTKQFVRQLRKIYDGISRDPPVRIIGLQWEKDGAFILNDLESLTRKPFLNRDIRNCSYIHGGDKLFPVGFSKDLEMSGHTGIIFLRWDPRNKAFTRIEPPAACRVMSLHPITLQKTVPNEYEIVEHKLDCFQVGFLKAKIINSSSAPIPALKLFFKNEAVPSYSQWDVCCSDPTLGNAAEGVYVFPLRDLPNWTFGGNCDHIKLVGLGPKHVVVKIVELTPVPEPSLIPKQTVISHGQEVKTVTDSIQTPVELHYDATKIPGASEVVCEILKPGTPDYWNLHLFNTLSSKQTIGRFIFAPINHDGDCYVIHIRCKDADGNWVSWWGDQLCVR